MNVNAWTLTKSHRDQIDEWNEKWIKLALSTEPINREKTAKAVVAMYASAGLAMPRIVYVQSPMMAVVVGTCASLFWRHDAATRGSTNAATRVVTDGATRGATYVATYAATDDDARGAARGVTDVATRGDTNSATNDATDYSTHAATQGATSGATDAATHDATYAATDAATDAATHDATNDATYVATDAVTNAATNGATSVATLAATQGATSAVTYGATYAATGGATRGATSVATDAATRGATDAATRGATSAVTYGATSVSTLAATQGATYAVTNGATYAVTNAATRGATDGATYDATRGATSAATDAATGAATDNATLVATSAVTYGATGGATSAATGAATDNATYVVTYVATSVATDAATCGATSVATDGATDAATGAATGAATDGATYAATDAATSVATYAATDAATHDATNDATYVATDGATDGLDQILLFAQHFCRASGFSDSSFSKTMKAWQRFCDYGNEISYVASFLSFVRDIVGWKCDAHKHYAHYEDAMRFGGFRYMHKKFCLISDRPSHRSVQKRNGVYTLHNESGPSIIWRCGHKAWHIDGRRVDEQIIMRPHTQTIDQIRAEDNAETKRIRIERYGWDQYLTKIGASVVDCSTDINGITEALMRTPDGETILCVACPSTGRTYAMEVDPACKTTSDGQNYLRAHETIFEGWGESAPSAISALPLGRA